MDERAVSIDVRLLWHLLRQNGRCLVCGDALIPGVKPPRYGGMSREHKVPKIHGGSDAMANIGASHSECNLYRGERMSLRWLRPEPPSGQKAGRKWRSQLLTTSPGGLWWTQRKIDLPVSASTEPK